MGEWFTSHQFNSFGKRYTLLVKSPQQKLISLPSILLQQTPVTHSSRSGKVAVHEDSVCRFTADMWVACPPLATSTNKLIVIGTGQSTEANTCIRARLRSSSDEDIDNQNEVQFESRQDNLSGHDCQCVFRCRTTEEHGELESRTCQCLWIRSFSYSVRVKCCERISRASESVLNLNRLTILN